MSKDFKVSRSFLHCHVNTVSHQRTYRKIPQTVSSSLQAANCAAVVGRMFGENDCLSWVRYLINYELIQLQSTNWYNKEKRAKKFMIFSEASLYLAGTRTLRILTVDILKWISGVCAHKTV